jgi:iron uptake system component EfeO
MVRRVPVRAQVAVLGLTLAACSGAQPSVSGGIGSTGNVVNVTASEFRFDPATISVKTGRTTFHVRNSGSQEHEFEVVKGDQEFGEIEGLVPGLEKELSVELPAGDYTIVCRLPGHLEQGMKATLTVTS